jgi:hypothetical protein
MIKQLAVALFLAGVAQPSAAATLAEAQSLYERNKVAEAERAFAAVSADSTATSLDRSAAERQLARVAWLIDADASRAVAHLKQATAIGGDRCADAAMLAKVLREAGRGVEALSRQEELLGACEAPDGKDSVRVHLTGALIDRAMGEPTRRAALLAAAMEQGALLTDRSDVEGARVRLGAALLSGNAAAALAAWKDFFWLDSEDAPKALARFGAIQRMTGGLAQSATIDDRLALAELLTRAGFIEEARRYAELHGLARAAEGQPVWRKLAAHWDAMRKVRAVEVRVNRGLARGKRDDTSLEQAAKEATVALMAAAGASGDPRQVLREHYGLVATVGKTSGYPSIHMGHLIEDSTDRVTQYGKSADVRLMVIDNMVGNGFESWLWDGSAMVGGWTADGTIVHVRPGYVRSPMQAFRLTYDSEDRRRVIARQKERAARDIADLKARPVATLEGLNDRLQLQLVDQVWSGAQSRATTADEAKRLFLADYSRANLDQSIRVHEGRHAIDNSLGLKDNVDQAVLEYQAKLAELALTAYPRMAFRNMNRSLEGEGPHDRGGARVFAEFKSWMEAHPDRIVGYDPAVPVLAQLDKLTDGQMREIAADLDPLSGKPIASADSPSGKSTTPRPGKR